MVRVDDGPFVVHEMDVCSGFAFRPSCAEHVFGRRDHWRRCWAQLMAWSLALLWITITYCCRINCSTQKLQPRGHSMTISRWSWYRRFLPCSATHLRSRLSLCRSFCTSLKERNHHHAQTSGQILVRFSHNFIVPSVVNRW